MKQLYLVLFLTFGWLTTSAQNFNIRTDSGWDTTRLCSGTLHDGGGAVADYSINSYGYFIIDPPGSETVSITFSQFDLGWGDYVYLYDGVGTSNYMGFYSGATLPNSGNAILSTSDAITIYFTSNYSGTAPGFTMDWTSSATAAPSSSFTVSNNNPAFSSNVSFTNTTSSVSLYEWHFGDGSTSTEDNPVHAYNTSGSFDAFLVSTNCQGSDTSVMQSIAVQTAPTFDVTPDTLFTTVNCGNTITSSLNINHTGGGTLLYDVEAREIGVNPYILKEDFESGLGSFTIDPTAGSSFIATAPQGTAASGTGYANITGFTNGYDGIYASFPSSQPKEISFQIFPQNTSFSGYISIGNSPDLTFQNMFYAYVNFGGQLRVSTWFGTFSYNINNSQWNHIELKNIDWTNNTYDIWINGSLGQAGIFFTDINTPDVNEVNLWSSSSTDCGFDDIEVLSESVVPINIIPASGVLSSTNSNTISLSGSTAGMIAGTYQYDVLFTTNGAGSDSLITVPWIVDVIGSPTMDLDKNCIAYDTVFLNLTYSDSIQIVNTGCDTLDISSITASNSDFSTIQNSLLVLPFDTSYLYVDFTPTALGTYADTLYLINNLSDTVICFTAVSEGAPIVSTDSSAYTINYLGCPDSVPFSFDIVNNGLSNLDWNISSKGVNSYFDDFENGFNSTLWQSHGSTSINGTCSRFSGANSLNFNGSNREARTNFLNLTTGDSIVFWAQPGNSSSPCEQPNSGENLFLEYSTNGFSWFSLGTVSYFNPGQFYRFTSPITGSVQLRLRQFSYTSSNIDNYSVDDFRIGKATASGGNFTPKTASTTAGDTTTVSGFFNTQDLLSGSYQRTVVISSNDPLDSIYSFDVTININGAPNLVYPVGCLDMDSLIAGTTSIDSVLIYNDGCDNLILSSFNTATNDFNVLSSVNTLTPDDSMYVYVQFQPTSTLGVLTDTLTINSNDTVAKICLSGIAKGAPLISVDTTTINVTINACDDSVLVNRTIYNNGQGLLNYEIGGSGSVPTLQEVLDTFRNGYTMVTAQIPSIYNFFDGIFGSSIGDGGGDMYDGGNIVSVDGNTLLYSHDLVQASTNLGPNGEYFTYKGTGIWLFAADLDAVNNFRISGNLGADGSGNVSAAILNQSIGGKNYTGYVKRVYSAGDPSINHLIIIEDDPAVSRTHLTTTGLENHNLNGLGNTTRLYYLLYAGSGGAFIDNAATQNIMNSFLQLVEQAGALSNWIRVNPDSAQVAVADSSVLDIWISSSGLPAGIHNGNITIATNDPANPRVDIPVTLTLNGIPEIIADTNTCLSFNNVLQGSTLQDTVWIYNAGCDTLQITSAQNQLSEFSVATPLPIDVIAGDSLAVLIDFTPITVGSFTDTLTLQNNDIPVSFCLDGTSLGAPLMTLSGDSLVTEVNKCRIIQNESFTITNIGQGTLDYDLRIGEYRGSNRETYNTVGASTFHTFKNTPMQADTLEVKVILNGDFAAFGQRSTLYINGLYYGQVYDNNVSTQTNDTVVFTIFGPNAGTYTMADSIQVDLYNTTSVGALAGSFHQIDIRVVKNTNWVAVTGSNTGPVSPNSSKTHNFLFNTAGLTVGRYETTLGINNSQANEPFANIPIVMYVISEESIELSDTCVNFPNTFINDTSTQSLVIYNTGCEPLNVNSIINTNSIFQLSPSSGLVGIDDSLVVTVDFLPVLPGNYSGSFIINNSDTTLVVCVNGTSVAKPIAGFRAFNDNSCLGKFIFQDTSQYAPTGWQWDFGDGNLSTASNPTHFYQNAGTYTVTLSVLNVNGVDTTSTTVTANPLFVDFAMSNDTVLVDSIVSFSDSSITGVSWSWDFDDGTTDTVQNPTHKFTQVGRYDVTLTVTDSRGCVLSTTKTIRVISNIGLSEAEKLGFSMDVYPNPTSGLLNLEVDASNAPWLNEMEIRLLDVTGKVIQSNIRITDLITALDLTNYPAGVYFIHLTRSGQLFAAKKIVLEK